MCQNRQNYLSEIKKKLFALNIHAIVLPSTDPHQSEYLASYWKLREWITGFTGSAGTVVITADMTGLWTDSRYYIQARKELSKTNIQLFREGEPDVLSPSDYLGQHLEEGSVVSINPKLWSFSSIQSLEKKLETKGISLNKTNYLIEETWNEAGRPPLPSEPVFIHQKIYSGASVLEKLRKVRNLMNEHDVKEHLITSLDDIAWLLNLRGHDIEYNPVFLSYAVVRRKDAVLFIDTAKVSPSVKKHLNSSNVIIKDYADITSYLKSVGVLILVNPDDCNGHLYAHINCQLIVNGPTLTRLLKACKTSHEISHIENAMVKDGVALAFAFYELYQRIGKITEYEFAKIIASKRSAQKGYYGESFPAIVGYEANGAIVHYRPDKEESALIQNKGILLCDSGGQYIDGTTDITRTVAVGPVTQNQKEHYTRVLKGHIAIDQAIFPMGTNGGKLDILARQYLWKSGLNYGHGTGHGVGYFLNVHEPPQGISPYTGSRSTTAFLPGMLTSNEPGYYQEGAYGIRIENLILTEESEHEGFLKHRHLTIFPIDTSLLIYGMLTREEVQWVNDYHQLVASKLLPYLGENVAEWMRQACNPI